MQHRVKAALLVIAFVISPIMALEARSQTPEPTTEELTVISAELGRLHYKNHEDATDFSVIPIEHVDGTVDYYGWIIKVRCRGDKNVSWEESVSWESTTHIPAPDPTLTPGEYEDDSTITVADDLKSWVTRRGAWCINGIARLDDIYGREDTEQLGDWRIEVRAGDQLLATFRYEVTGHYQGDP